jgi:hypothetical protein
MKRELAVHVPGALLAHVVSPIAAFGNWQWHPLAS